MADIKAIAGALGVTQAALSSIISALGIDDLTAGDFGALQAVVSIKRVQGVSYKKAAEIWQDSDGEIPQPMTEQQVEDDEQGIQGVLTQTQQALATVDEDDLFMAHRMAQGRALRVVEAVETLFPIYLGQAAGSAGLIDRRATVHAGLEEVFCRPLLSRGEPILMIAPMTAMSLLPESLLAS
jgi:hypothetical protein